MQNRWTSVLLVVLAALWLIPTTLPLLDQADGAGYLAATASLARDGDVLYLDEYTALGMSPRYFRSSPTGLVANHWSLGPSLAYLPAYALAARVDPTGAADGPIPLTAMQATSLLFCLLWAVGTWRLLRAAEPGAPRWRCGLVIACLYVGTPLFFYAHAQSLRPHLLEATLATWFVAVHAPRRARMRVEDAAALGLLGAALFLVRSQAAALFVLPALTWLEQRAKRSVALGEAAVQALWLGVPLVLARALASGYRRLLYGDTEASAWRALTDVDWDIALSLLSPHHGLLPWSPVLLVAWAGMGLAVARQRDAFWLGALVVLGIQIYLNGTSFYQEADRYHYTRHWDGGASFGGRRYLGMLPFFALGLQAAVQRWPRAASIVSVACSLPVLALAVHAGAAPSLVLQGATDGPVLARHYLDAVRDLPRHLAQWRERTPAAAAMAWGWLAAVAQLGVLGLVALARSRLQPPWRRRVLALGGVAVAALVGLAAARVRDATLEEAARQRGELRRLAEVTQETRWRVERGIRLERARLRVLAGDVEGALAQYREVTMRGLGAASLGEYAALSRRHEGEAVWRRRLEELRAAHPGHPVLSPTP